MCHGPVDGIEQILVGERLAWSGNQTASGAISINVPDLFGGESKEGGIQGTLDVMMGEPSQGINSYLLSKQGSPQPAYRGILGLVYRGGLIACNNPYVKPWAVRVRRVLKGWHSDQVWYSSRASISVGSGITAANPAHIIYECLTNPSWGMGYPSSLIDNSSFQTAADAFYNEGLGLCIMWSQQDSLDNFIQLVLDHAGAVLSQDSGGGFFKLKALRGDYTPSALDLFDDNNGKVVSLERIERTTYTENVNEIAIQYIDATTGRSSSIYVQNLSNIQAQGSVVSQTRQYPGIPNANLAARIGMRDLKATTSGLARITFVANRSAYHLVPGDVIRFAWQPAGIASMSLRITRIDYGPLTSGLIRIEALEDVFGLPSAVYADPPPIAWTPPNYTPQPAGSTLAMEATYKDLYDRFGPNDIGTVTALDGYLIAAATRPTNALSFNYQLQTRAGTASYENRDFGDWAPTGTLVSGITKTATSITLQAALDIDMVGINTLALLGTGTTAEIVQVTAVDTNTNTLTIKRGCIDTTPKEWPSGTRFTSHDLYGVSDDVEYVSAEQVSARFLTKTSTETLAEASAPVATVTMNQRAARPYPPGLLRLNSQTYPASVNDSLIVSWAHRDRITQADQVLGQTESSVGPEPGTSYRLRGFHATTNASLFDVTTTSTSHTYTPSGTVPVNLDLRSIRDGLESYQIHQHNVTVVVPGVATLAETTDLSTSQIAVAVPALATISVTTGQSSLAASGALSGVADWTPGAISSDLSSWFDAANSASIIQSGGAVSEWRDISGNSRHAVQATASYRPAYSATGFNNSPTLTFSGDALWAPIQELTGLCVAIVFQRTSDGTTFQIRSSTNGNPVIDDEGIGGFGTRLRNNAGNIIAGVRMSQNQNPHVGVWVFSGGVLQLYLDGGLGSSVGVSGTYSMDRFSIGGNGIDVVTQAFSGKISEVVVTNIAPTQSTRQQLEGYLAWKWGTVGSLPANHPYKTQKPQA